jgi:hypothetical protein
LLSFFCPVFSVTLPATHKEVTVKLQIYLTDAMATALLTLAQQERRYPRQQAEILLERALAVSMPLAQTAHSMVSEGQTMALTDASAPVS